MERTTGSRRSASPPLPSARSLLHLSTDCSRPLPRLHPLPPRSPTLTDCSDKTLLVFLHPDRATAAAGLQAMQSISISPRSVAAPQQQEEVEPAAKSLSRKRSARDLDDHRTSSDDGTGGDTPRTRKRSTPGCKGRKPTYLVRKEEKGELEEQIKKLEAQLEYLKHSTSTECLARAFVRRTDHKFFEQEMHNHLLREAVRNQHFQLFSAQSALSELTYSIQQNQCPINTFIHLGCDIQQRRKVLENMKAQKLRDAKQLMDKRVQFLRDPAEQRRETAQFPTDSGALCSVIFDVTPVDGNAEIEDVVRAYTAASRYIESMGTMMPPYTGDDAGVRHGRLQIDTSPEMPTESSFVVFSELQKPTFSEVSDHSDKCVDPVGMIVLDSVDEDELHPYRPSEYLREDVNAVVTLTRGSRRQNGYKGNDPDKRVPCLILTRWVLLTLRPDPKGVAPAGAMDFLLQTCINMGNEMLHAIQEAATIARAAKPRAVRQPWTLESTSASSSTSDALNVPS